MWKTERITATALIARLETHPVPSYVRVFEDECLGKGLLVVEDEDGERLELITTNWDTEDA
jgi:hypothetical protein